MSEKATKPAPFGHKKGSYSPQTGTPKPPAQPPKQGDQTGQEKKK